MRLEAKEMNETFNERYIFVKRGVLVFLRMLLGCRAPLVGKNGRFG